VRADVAAEADVFRSFTRSTRGSACHRPRQQRGIVEPQMRLEMMTAERIARMFAVNVVGTMLRARAVRRMSTSHGGRAASSSTSRRSRRLGSPGDVDARRRRARSTRSRSVSRARSPRRHPRQRRAAGFTYTEIHARGGEPGRVDRLSGTVPLQRGAQPVEIARAILWLMSSEASYATGAILDIGGGK
jgi:NAD(P)-dependent dehydrogenase (short-subunit alcohol dehydrogenase family)